MKIVNIICWVLLIIGGLNWLLIGLFSWNLVAAITGGVQLIMAIIYSLVGLSAIWLIISPIISKGKISLWNKD